MRPEPVRSKESAENQDGGSREAGWRDDRTPVSEMKTAVRAFALQRDWERFHTPRNLAMALAVEAGELLELFLWVDEGVEGGRPPPDVRRVEGEVADVAILLLDLCNRLDIDLSSAIERKLSVIAAKYPAERVRGLALKYNEYEGEDAERGE